MRAEGTIADRFVIDGVVASGGMGTIHRARDKRSGAVIALKLLFDDDASSLARFEREARSIADLEHPCIVRYVDHGTSDGRAYLAMEWLEGEDLATRLSRGPLAESDAILVVRAVAEASPRHMREGS